MVQEIITYLIIGGAVGAIVLRSFNALKPHAKKIGSSNSKCDSCTIGCALKDLNISDEKKCPDSSELKLQL